MNELNDELKNARILIVDDTPKNIQVLGTILKQEGYQINVAQNGLQALKTVEKVTPDLILLDVMMPELDGFETCKILKQNEKTKDIPVIFLTAKVEPTDVVKGFELGAVDYITKPFNSTELIMRVRTHLELKFSKELIRKAAEQEKADLETTLEMMLEHNDEMTSLLKSETEEAIRVGEKRLAQFLNAVPIGVFVIDRTGQPYYANQMAYLILGGANLLQIAQYLLGNSIDWKIPEELKETCQTYIAGTEEIYPLERQPIICALRGESAAVSDVEVHKENAITPLEISATPIFGENGQIEYAIAVFQDITQRKRVETERVQFTEKLSQLNKSYERFVPHQFLKLLDKDSVINVKLGDQVEKEMTIMFSDIRGFTSISEKMSPQEIFDFINAYFGQMEPIILQYNGVIDKYIGDAIMALFPANADDALTGAITMLKVLTEYNVTLQKKNYQPIQVGIGLNTGPLMLGTIGGQNRMDGTVISDAVNLASRVEGLTKTYGVPLLITMQTHLKLTNAARYKIRIVDSLKVRGKSEEVTVYEVFDADPPDIIELKVKTRRDFAQGFMLYHQEEYIDAIVFFEKVLKINQQDKVAKVYLERCYEKKRLVRVD